jgi:hypothetical protein
MALACIAAGLHIFDSIIFDSHRRLRYQRLPKVSGWDIKSDQTNVNLVKCFEYHPTVRERYTNVAIYNTVNLFILVKLIFGVSRVGTQLAKLKLEIFLVHSPKTNRHI